jgi:hypothetical protein
VSTFSIACSAASLAARARSGRRRAAVVGRVRVFTDFDTEPVMRANRAYHVSGFASVGKALSSIHRLRGDAWIDSAVRGRTVAAALLDEVAFWRSEESANPDAEVLAALRPSMLTIPNSPLLAISTPYSRRVSSGRRVPEGTSGYKPVNVPTNSPEV